MVAVNKARELEVSRQELARANREIKIAQGRLQDGENIPGPH